MTALSDRANMIEHQRQRLYDGITRIYDVAHAYCACPDSEIKRLADKVCAEAERIEKEGTGE